MMFLPYNSDVMSAFPVYYSSIALVLVVLASTVIRRRYFSPIKDVPGPFLSSITRLHHVYHIYMGKQSHWITKLHEEYGPCVRIAPDEVSVSHPDAPKKLLLSVLHKVSRLRLQLGGYLTWADSDRAHSIMRVPCQITDFKMQSPCEIPRRK